MAPLQIGGEDKGDVAGFATQMTPLLYEFCLHTNHVVCICWKKHGYLTNFNPKANQVSIDVSMDDSSEITLSKEEYGCLVSQGTLHVSTAVVLGPGIDAISSDTLTE